MSDERVKKAFDSIKAEETLKENTRQYVKIKTKGYRGRSPRKYRRLAMVMACLVVILTGAGGYGMYFTPVSAISIDTKPSVELGVNRFGKVISVDNHADKESTIESADVKHLEYSEAVERLLADRDTDRNPKDDGEVFITVTGESRERCEKMRTRLVTQTEGHGNVHCAAGSATEVEEARKTGMPVGKYRAFLELKKLDETVELEDVQGLTMRQIRDRISELAGNKSTGEHGHGKKHKRGQSAH